MKLLLFLLLFPTIVVGQMVELESFVLNDRIKYSKEDVITLGKPSGKDSTFEHIYYFKGLSGRKVGLRNRDASTLTIAKIQMHGDIDNANYIIIAMSNKGDKYHCEIKSAIETGEVIGDENYDPKLEHTFTIDDIPLKNGYPYYEEIIEVGPTYTKSQVFKAAKRSLIKFFKDAKEVIQDEDAAEGMIMGKGIKRDYKDKITFTFEIAVKDGKYRIRLYDHHIEWFRESSYIGTTKIGTTEWADVSFSGHYDEARKGRRFSKNVLKKFHLSNQEIIYSLQLLMLDELKERKDDDW